MIWLWYNLIYDIWYMIYDIWYVSTMKLKLYSIFTNIRCSPWVQRPSVAGSAACQLMAWVKKQRKVSTIQSNYLKKTETTKLTSNFCTCTYPNPPFLCSNSHLPPLPKLLPPNKIDTISNKNSPPFPSSPWYTFSLRFSGCRRDWLRVEEDEPLMAAGMDSLSSVEFRNRLSAEAGAGIKFPKLGWETEKSCWGEWKGVMTLNWYIYKCITIKLEKIHLYV